MKNLILLLVLLLVTSCATAFFNKADAKVHYYNTVSHGQQLLDLKKALDANAITQEEYDSLKAVIMIDVVDWTAGKGFEDFIKND